MIHSVINEYKKVKMELERFDEEEEDEEDEGEVLKILLDEDDEDEETEGLILKKPLRNPTLTNGSKTIT